MLVPRLHTAGHCNCQPYEKHAGLGVWRGETNHPEFLWAQHVSAATRAGSGAALHPRSVEFHTALDARVARVLMLQSRPSLLHDSTLSPRHHWLCRNAKASQLKRTASFSHNCASPVSKCICAAILLAICPGFWLPSHAFWGVGMSQACLRTSHCGNVAIVGQTRQKVTTHIETFGPSRASAASNTRNLFSLRRRVQKKYLVLATLMCLRGCMRDVFFHIPGTCSRQCGKNSGCRRNL